MICNYLPSLPDILSGAAGAYINQAAIVCSGYFNEDREENLDCFELDMNSTEWEKSVKLQEGRSSVAFTELQNDTLFVAGDGSFGYSSELVSLTPGPGSSWPGPEVPQGAARGCVVSINSTTLAFLGTGIKASKIVYFYNMESGEYTQGPDMEVERYFHSCGILTASDGSKKLVVAGGYLEKSVEIMDLDSVTWTDKFNLGKYIWSSAMVPSVDGHSLILIGGNTFKSPYTESIKYIYEIKEFSSKRFGYSKMEQELKIARSSHVAFGVPDSLVDCREPGK